MTAAERNARRNERLLAAGRCVQCGEKQKRGRNTWRCAACVIKNRANGQRCYYRALEQNRCGACRKSWDADGHATCPPCRLVAKERFARGPGYSMAKLAPSEGRGSRRLAALDNAVSCQRCGLRGEHQCLPDRADPWQRKGGPSYPEPGGCTFTKQEKAHMGKVESKFVRFTNAKRDAVRAGR